VCVPELTRVEVREPFAKVLSEIDHAVRPRARGSVSRRRAFRDGASRTLPS
jgi:hypothetical protein